MEERPHSLLRFFNHMGIGFVILSWRTEVIRNVTADNVKALGNTFAYVFPQVIILALMLMLLEDFYLYLKSKYIKRNDKSD